MRKPKSTKPRVRTHSECLPDPTEKGSTITRLYADVIVGKRLAIKLSGPRCVEHANEIVTFLNSVDPLLLKRHKGQRRPTQLSLTLDYSEPKQPAN